MKETCSAFEICVYLRLDTAPPFHIGKVPEIAKLLGCFFGFCVCGCDVVPIDHNLPSALLSLLHVPDDSLRHHLQHD